MKDKNFVKMLSISPKKGEFALVSVADFSDILRHLDCGYLDVHIIGVNGIRYCAYFDDTEMLMNRPHYPVLLDSEMHPLVYGNVVISMMDNEGNDISLTEEQIDTLVDNAITIQYGKHGPKYHAIGGVEW